MLATVAVIAAGWDGTLARFEGVLLLVAFVGVLAACIGRTRKEKPELQDAIAAFARTSTGLGQNLLRFAIAVVLLYFGARWVVQSAPVIGLALRSGEHTPELQSIMRTSYALFCLQKKQTLTNSTTLTTTT